MRTLKKTLWVISASEGAIKDNRVLEDDNDDDDVAGVVVDKPVLASSSAEAAAGLHVNKDDDKIDRATPERIERRAFSGSCPQQGRSRSLPSPCDVDNHNDDDDTAV